MCMRSASLAADMYFFLAFLIPGIVDSREKRLFEKPTISCLLRRARGKNKNRVQDRQDASAGIPAGPSGEHLAMPCMEWTTTELRCQKCGKGMADRNNFQIHQVFHH